MTQRPTNRLIEEYHAATVEARGLIATVHDPEEPAKEGQPSPKEKLQRVVARYYAELRSALLSSREGRRYYFGEPPEESDDLGYGVIERRTVERTVLLENLPAPPENMPSIKREQFYAEAVDEMLRDNRVLIPPLEFVKDREKPAAICNIEEYRTGLRVLDKLYKNRVEVETDDDSGKYANGSFMEHIVADGPETEQRLELAPLEILVNAARELDRAAQDLGLLAETRESDSKPYMGDFTTSDGEPSGEVDAVELNGAPEV